MTQLSQHGLDKHVLTNKPRRADGIDWLVMECMGDKIGISANPVDIFTLTPNEYLFKKL